MKHKPTITPKADDFSKSWRSDGSLAPPKLPLPISKEPTLASLHPLHFADLHMHRVSKSPSLHGSFFLNLPHVSRSPELSRAYQVGDPVRLIDWKAYARNDQLIVREERDEAMASVVIVVDGRNTMLWPDESVDKKIRDTTVRKFEVALRLGLHLAHRYGRLGDRVRLVLLDDKFTEDHVLAIDFRSPSQVLSLFEELEKKEFSLDSFESFLSVHNLYYPRTHIAFWISDCCVSAAPEILIKHPQNFVLLHTLSALECELSWMEDRECYFDESLVKKEFLGAVLKDKNRYIEKLKKWSVALQKSVESHYGHYVLFTDRTQIRSYIAALDGVLR